MTDHITIPRTVEIAPPGHPLAVGDVWAYRGLSGVSAEILGVDAYTVTAGWLPTEGTDTRPRRTFRVSHEAWVKAFTPPDPTIPADAIPDLDLDPWAALCRLSEAASVVLGAESTHVTICHGKSVLVEAL